MPLAAIETVFSGNPLDRADHLRSDPEVFGELMRRSDARVALMADDKILSDHTGDILWQPTSGLRFLPVSTTIFLGFDNNIPCYAAHLSGSEADFADLFPSGIFIDGRMAASKLHGRHPSLAIIAQAKSMLLWHESHRYCAKCGAESALARAGYERKCPKCNTSHFPRTDPVVIMMVYYGEKALLGRGHGWPEGRYSALAGYVEPGESFEEAVAREVKEEVNLTVTKVQYVASQPWPWPSSLMIGAEAWVDCDDITVDKTELEDAIWVSKQDVINSMQEGSSVRLMPPPFAIAYNLISNWVERDQ
ncbi:NAD(+) diphosphatase [Kordiimonas pumila]|uniref:NAD(+) diphosphatase n=1 Tax=Kordiimonas pumila TaxID=2161677 RepID=A0ABV7CZU1_9PROT|nr:NAD(+) diphosphatase [Kordiimonas pumila]